MKVFKQYIVILFITVLLVPSPAHVVAFGTSKMRVVQNLENEYELLKRTLFAMKKVTNRQVLSAQELQDVRTMSKQATAVAGVFLGTLAVTIGGPRIYRKWQQQTSNQNKPMPFDPKELGTNVPPVPSIENLPLLSLDPNLPLPPLPQQESLQSLNVPSSGNLPPPLPIFLLPNSEQSKIPPKVDPAAARRNLRPTPATKQTKQPKTNTNVGKK